MNKDEDDPLILSKWPFYLGDALLVATALAIAILDNWDLSNWQVASCVMAVALGAGLLVLPYVVEYYLRGRELSDDREAQFRALRRRIEAMESEGAAIAAQFKEVHSQVAASARSGEVLASAVDQKLEMQERVGAERAAELIRSMERLGETQAQLETQTAAQKEAMEKALRQKAGVEMLDVTRSHLTTLDARVAGLTEPLAGLQALSERVESFAEMTERLQLLEQSIAELAESAAAAPRPTRSARQRHAPEPRLLHRAIKEPDASEASAVSRIIRAKNSKPEVPEDDAEAASELSPDAEADTIADEAKRAAETSSMAEEAAENTENAAASGESPNPEPAQPEAMPATPVEDAGTGTEEPVPDAEEEPGTDADRDHEVDAPSELEEPAEPEPEPATEREAQPEPEPATESESESESAPEPEDESSEAAPKSPPAELFEAPEQRSLGRIRSKKRDTVLTVCTLIGIGNKPFIRGSAGGLSWEKGVPLDFEEIGKWTWTAPADLETAVEVQIYRNDEDPDWKGRHVLEPGQKLEINPVF